MKIRFLALLLSAMAPTAGVFALDKNLPVPVGEPTADELARQVYFANHFYAFKNFSIERRGSTMTVLINRDPDGSVNQVALERHLNNDYPEGDATRSRDLAIFHSGKMRGFGLLVTDPSDESQSQTYNIWIPTMRKIRRFAEPDYREPWGGSVFTFGDVTLRKPNQETHEIIGKKVFHSCLGVIESLEEHEDVNGGRLPKRACRHANKEVYGLKSTPKGFDWGYDYRLSFVDAINYADYRTVYYKDGQMIKVIDRDWGVVQNSGKADPRALFWKYWYGLDLVENRESWAVIPQNVVAFDTNKDAGFWSDRTLEKLNR